MPLRTNMEPKDYLEIIVRRKWIVVFAFLIVCCFVLYYLIVTPVTYKSSTTILIIPQKVGDTYVRSSGSGWIEQRLGTLQPLIMSRTRLLKVIDEVGLFKGDPKHPRPPEDIMVEGMRKKIEIVVNRTDSFTLSFMHTDPMTAMLVTSRLASFFMEENQKTREQQAEDTAGFLDIKIKEEKYNLLAQEEKIREYKYRHLDELPGQTDANIAAINQYQIQYKNLNDKLALAEERKKTLELRNRSLDKTLRLIISDNALPQAVDSAAGEPGTVTNDNDTGLSPQTDLARKKARLAELSQRYTDNFPEIRQLKLEIKQMEAANYDSRKKEDSAKTGRNSQGDMNRLYRRLLPSQMEEKLFVREDIAQADKEIAALKKQIKETQESINKYQIKLKNAPIREEEWVKLTRDFDRQKGVFEDLKRKKQDFEMSEALEKRQEQARFKILDPADLPKSPVSPDVDRIIKIAIMAAFALGFGGAFGMEALDTRIRGLKDFKHYFQIPVLATLPVIQGRDYFKRRKLKIFAISGGIFSLIVLISILAYIYTGKVWKI